MGIEVTGIRTVVIYVGDVERSKLFYADMLGLPVVYERDSRVGLDLGGGTRLLLHPSEPDDVRGRHGRIEVYLRVADVDAAVAFLRERGTPVLQEPTDEGWGERDAAVLDPDGYPIFLTETPREEWSGNERPVTATASEPRVTVGDPSLVVVDSSQEGRVTVEGTDDLAPEGARITSGRGEVREIGDAILVRGSGDIHVRVPHDVHVSVRADNHVTVAGIDRGADISTSEGHIWVRDCRGDVTINTGDGHVTVEDLIGALDVTTGDGHVKGNGLDGAVRIRTGDGHVRLTGDVVDVEVDTGDGEIYLDGGRGFAHLRTGSGEVTARGTFTDVTATTGDGPISVDWCDGRIRLETGDGDVNFAGRLDGDSRISTGDGTARIDLAPDSSVGVDTKAERVVNEFVPGTATPTGRLRIRAGDIIVMSTGANARRRPATL